MSDGQLYQSRPGRTYADKPAGLCRWFAMCQRYATTTIDHPVLGAVPVCQSCADKAKGSHR